MFPVSTCVVGVSSIIGVSTISFASAISTTVLVSGCSTIVFTCAIPLCSLSLFFIFGIIIVASIIAHVGSSASLNILLYDIDFLLTLYNTF